MKQNHLFNDNGDSQAKNPRFDGSREIYHDFLSSEAWFTHSEHCVQVSAEKEAKFEGDLGIHIIWNKQAGDCPWLGLGFGWDAWSGKDLGTHKNELAIEFWARTLEGERDDLPWAIGLEDFTGSQAWLGMSTKAVQANKITTEWTRIELPLSEFNWEEQNADAFNIKQIIFNLEGEGEIYMDEVSIVPYNGGFRNRATLTYLTPNSFIVDGKKDDPLWETEAQVFGSNKVHLALIDSFLCIGLEVEDKDPLQNANTGDNIFNGDAFEISFSTDAEASMRRTTYLSSDQHIAFSLGDEINSWNFRKHLALKSYTAISTKTENGYIAEFKINLKEFGIDRFEDNMLYGLEMAVDHGSKKGRERQDRWNDVDNHTFYENPSIWGEMIIKRTMIVEQNL